MGIFSWGKYAKTIINAEKQFIKTWNHSLSEDEKTDEGFLQAVMLPLFFYSEKSKLSPNEFSKMVSGIRKSSPFYNLISGLTVYEKKAVSDIYSNVYGYYLSAIRNGSNTGDAYIYAAEKQSKIANQQNL